MSFAERLPSQRLIDTGVGFLPSRTESLSLPALAWSRRAVPVCESSWDKEPSFSALDWLVVDKPGVASTAGVSLPVVSSVGDSSVPAWPPFE